ncbi:MAG: 1-acyl-sn-glycerol-3-phosphate acyltransferase [Pirellulaceae bacterium]|nr:1-acyl-sn-glycerol-3-phosphate acyltransferase [Pirellulaceae bacterium]
MTVVFDRPYEFVQRDPGTVWPWFIQRLRLVDRYLRVKEGVYEHDVRNLDRLIQSTQRGDGVVLAPNHCRYADPLIMVWPARQSRLNFYAMASWHLFNTGWFDTFAMRKCGAFSLNREGTDRKSLETGIEIIVAAERPLILFAEGMTYRTNDWLRPLLDGVSFMARTAARRRAKKGGGNVVVHPVAIKYLCVDDPSDWADQQLSQLERMFGWQKVAKISLVQRTLRISNAMLALSEVEHLGATSSGDVEQRRMTLVKHLIHKIEARLKLNPPDEDAHGDRLRVIRSQLVLRYFALSDGSQEREQLRHDADSAELALSLLAYPNRYLESDDVTDTRVVETIQRIQEMLLGKPNREVRLKCVIDFGEAIEVPAEKAPRGQPDPLLEQIATPLRATLNAMAREARPMQS